MRDDITCGLSIKSMQAVGARFRGKLSYFEKVSFVSLVMKFVAALVHVSLSNPLF
jgi:hypothetical protein